MTRIVSLLPAATEMVYALGAGAELVGRSHECDYPDAVRRLPVVSKPTIQLDGASAQSIDKAVTERLGSGETLYAIDEVLLRKLRPDLILTQNLCRVCAPSGDELTRAVRSFEVQPEVLFLTPTNLREIDENISAVGRAIGRQEAATDLILAKRERVAAVRQALSDVTPLRVAFLEWTDPVFCAGHWVPEMISLAGGHDPLGRPGEDSVRVEWEQVVAGNPELVLVSPCGYRLDEAIKLARKLPKIPGATVYAVDANAYFARPGPRAPEGVELLAHLFHPDKFGWPHQHKPWERVD